jgi:hypothetical protein
MSTNIERGMRSAEYALRRARSEKSAEEGAISAGEVAHIFGSASRYLEDSEKLTFADKAKLALKILSGDVTKPGITAVLEQLDLNPPTDPIIDPDPDPIIVRPRYGLMEMANPIIARLNAPGASDPEDIARAQVLARVAELAATPAPRAARRSFALTASSVRVARGQGNTQTVRDVQSALNAAIANATAG